MQKSYITILGIILLCSSCGNKLHLKKIKTVSFDTGFSPLGKLSGVFEKDNKTYFYFCDNVSLKKIVFIENFKVVKEISLKNVSDIKEKVDGIHPVTLDSIIILTAYTNKILLLDSKGDIVINRSIKEDDFPNKRKYELFSSFLGSNAFYVNNDLWLYCYPSYSDFHNDNNPIIKQRDNLNRRNLEPNLIRISNAFTSDIKLKMGLDSLFVKFIPKDHCNVEAPFYCATTREVIFYSTYSDKLFIVDPHTIKLTREITITSKHTNIGGTPIKINEETFPTLSEQNNIVLQTAGAIRGVFYDIHRNLYYCTIMHEVDKNVPKEQRGARRDWSILILNDEFKILSEQKMPPFEYQASNLLLTKEGVWVSNNIISSKNYDNDKAVYTLFKIFK
jgi:hypothetical protein